MAVGESLDRSSVRGRNQLTQSAEYMARARDAEEATCRAYVEKNISDWGNVLVPDGFDSEVARKFELSAIPRSILVDPEGKIVAIDDDARGTKLLLLLEKQLRERY